VGATPNALTNMNSVASTYTLKGDKTWKNHLKNGKKIKLIKI
jgi:Na+/glutamate symporter